MARNWWDESGKSAWRSGPPVVNESLKRRDKRWIHLAGSAHWKLFYSDFNWMLGRRERFSNWNRLGGWLTTSESEPGLLNLIPERRIRRARGLVELTVPYCRNYEFPSCTRDSVTRYESPSQADLRLLMPWLRKYELNWY